MIKLPSVQRDFTLIYSGDPALDLPAFASDSASDDEKQASLEARAQALKVARETGNWPIKAGESPTLFHFTPDPGLAYDYFESEIRRGHQRKKPLSAHELAVLIFRIALRKVENIGPLKLEFEDIDGYRLVSAKFVESIYALGDVGRALVAELGALAYERIRDPIGPL